jgi:hypothetical protein
LCHLEPNWSRHFPREAQLLLAHGATASAGPVITGRHFEGFSEGTALLGFSNTGDLRFQRRFEGRSAQIARVGSGFVLTQALKNDLVVTRLGQDGSTLSETQLHTEEEDHAEVILPTGEGFAVISTAAKYPSSLGDVQANRFDANGTHLWTKTWATPPKVEFRFIGALASADGGLIVGIHHWLNGGHGPPRITALNASGNVLWEYTDSVHFLRGDVRLLLPTQGGGVVMAGSIDKEPGPGEGPARVIHLSASGSVRWASSLDDGSGRQQLIADGVQLKDGGYAFIGYSANSAQGRLWRLRANGSIAWTRDYPDVSAGLTQIRNLPNGGFVVGASRWSLDGEDLIEVLQLDAQGDVVRRHRALGEGVASFGALDVDPAGRVLAVGAWSNDQERQSHVMQLSEVCERD